MIPINEMRAFILSGGAARRAGGMNKSFMEIEGKPIIAHQLERLIPVFGERITVITDRPRDYADFPIARMSDVEMPEIAEEERSGLRGIVSALYQCMEQWAFILGGDMPWPDAAVLEKQREAATAAELDVEGVCLEGPTGAEPFHGIYRRGLWPRAMTALYLDKSIRHWIVRMPSIRVIGATEMGLPRSRLDRCLANFNEPPPIGNA